MNTRMSLKKHSMLLSCNDLFHGALENLWRRPNAQSAVEVSAKWTDKRSEFGRFIIQWNLPKFTHGIQLGKDGGSLQFVNNVFNCQYNILSYLITVFSFL